MLIESLSNISRLEAEQLQRELASQVIVDGKPSVSLVAGVDVAYEKGSDQIAAAVVILDVVSLEVVEKATVVTEAVFEYVPGLFSFRELPPVLEAFEKITMWPDVVVCDGHGVAHPRRFGLACHLGVELDVPAIGCAKNVLIGEYEPVADERGSITPLIDDGEQVGTVVRTQTGIKPVFVSPGHKIGFAEAASLVVDLAPKYRLPETTRQSDQLANQVLSF